MTMFSVVTATFDVEDVVGNLAASIASQRYRDAEWVVQDGGSRDGTLGALDAGDVPTSIESRPDGGVYDALNRAVSRARGDYLLFLGADDVLANDGVLDDLARSITACSRPPIALLGRCEFGEDARPFTSALSTRTWAVNTVHHQAAAYGRALFDDFRYDDRAAVTADYGLTLELLARREEVAVCPVMIARCGAHGLSRTGSEISNYREMYRLRRGRIPTVMNVAGLAAGLANVARRRALG